MDVVTTADPRESRHLGSQLLGFAETATKQTALQEGRRGREQKVIGHLLLASIVLELFMFSPALQHHKERLSSPLYW